MNCRQVADEQRAEHPRIAHHLMCASARRVVGFHEELRREKTLPEKVKPLPIATGIPD